MRVKLFTHTDLDGVGCAIVGKFAFRDGIDIVYCYNPDDVSKKVKEFIENKEYVNYSFVYITDISVNEEVAELINNTQINTFKESFYLGEMFQLLDHHPTAEFLNKYDWANVSVEINGEKTSGTRLFYDFLGYPEDTGLFSFVENIRKYDTWLWKTKYNDKEPKKWNDLLYIMGRDNFIDDILFRLTYNYGKIELNVNDLKLLQYKQGEIDRYIESKNKQIIRTNILGYNVGFVFAEQFHSELGNSLCEQNPDIDFIAIINPGSSVSYRTIKDIDLGKDIAKIYGGGGHPKAAGSPISEEVKNKIIELIFTKEN